MYFRCIRVCVCFAGDTLLYATMAVEIVGGRQNPRTDDGPGHWHLFGNRKETEKGPTAGLSVGEFKVIIGWCGMRIPAA